MPRTGSVTAARSLPPAQPQESLTATDAKLARILGAIEEYVYIGEFLDGGAYQLVFAGPCRERFLGMPAEAARTAIWADYVHPGDAAVFDAAHISAWRSGALDAEYRLIGADGVVRWVHDRGRVRVEDGRCFLDGSILDVTEVHAARAALELAHARAARMARTDELTGAANRRGLPELLERFRGRPLGLLGVDIDRFKCVNDLYGHAAGDAVLQIVARRLNDAVRPEDRLVRTGGEEFLLLLDGLKEPAELAALAERARRAVADTPVEIEGRRLTVTVSVGATMAPPAQSSDAMLAAADRHLYAAKRAGRNRVHTAQDGAADEDGEDDGGLLRLARAVALSAEITAGQRPEEERRLSVSTLSGRVARRLGLSAPLALRCRLAGLLSVAGAHGPGFEARPGVHADPARRAALLAAVPELATLAEIVEQLDERFDGGGGPVGLAGETIAIEARILSAAAAWYAHTANRGGLVQPPEALARAAGVTLDPAVVVALLDAVEPFALEQVPPGVPLRARA